MLCYDTYGLPCNRGAVFYRQIYSSVNLAAESRICARVDECSARSFLRHKTLPLERHARQRGEEQTAWLISRV